MKIEVNDVITCSFNEYVIDNETVSFGELMTELRVSKRRIRFCSVSVLVKRVVKCSSRNVMMMSLRFSGRSLRRIEAMQRSKSDWPV